MDRQEAMEQEFKKRPGGNYFSFVDTAKLERLGITQWKPEQGSSSIRIVFPSDRPGFYGMEVYKHSNIGVNRKTFLCKRKMFEQVCPICNLADEFRAEDPQDERAAALYASRRYLFFVVDVSSNEAMAKGIRWFDCPIGLYNEIKIRSKQKRTRGSDGTMQEDGPGFKKYIDVSHPSEGRDIVFEQVKEGKKYSYVGVDLQDNGPCPEGWYQDLPEFKDVLKESTDEEILEALSGEQTPDENVEVEGREEEVQDDTQEATEDSSSVEEEVRAPETQVPKRTPVETRGTRAPVESTASRKEEDIKRKVQERLAANRRIQE